MPDKQILDPNGNPIPVFSPGTVVVIDGTITGTSTQSAAVLSATDDVIVRITVSADSYLAFGTNPTAAATSMRIWAKSTENFIVKKNHKVAVLGGIVNITIHNTTT